MKPLMSLSLLILALMLPGIALAADDARRNDIDVKLVQNKVTRQDGADRLVAIDQIAPGDVIQYEATYSNTTQRAVHGLKADLPIPLNTQYVMESAQPRNVLASTDGATYAPSPLKRKIRNANGVVEEREVPVSEYRHLRWELGELPGGKSVTVVARVRVDALPQSKNGEDGR